MSSRPEGGPLPIDAFGVRPRSTFGLIGILAHPFLHAGVGHLIGNSFALLLFGSMVMLKEESHLYITSVIAVLVGGLGIWIFGRNANHIGASGLVFGLFGYLLSTGWFEKKIGSLILSIVVLVGWGSMLWGMLPTASFVSWEGHLFGFAGGVLSARLLARKPTDRPKRLPAR